MIDKLTPRPNGGQSELITFVPDRPGHDFRYAIDFSKLKAELGWQPEAPLNGTSDHSEVVHRQSRLVATAVVKT